MSGQLSVVPPSSPPESHLDWALRYVRLGWPVFPLGIKSKQPMIAAAEGGKGCLDASLDEKAVRAWWGRWPKANIGVATGHRFFVFDVDPLKGGSDSLDFLINQHGGRLPDTIQQVTGTGGTHYLFQLPDFPVQNTESFIAQGLDTRGYHGYIVAAPSVHPDTGREYFWDGVTEIEEQRIAAAPGWMLDKLRQHGQRAGGPTPVPAKIPKGQQHKYLVSLAGTLRKRGLDAEAIFVTLRFVNATQCTEPGPEANIRRIADSVARYAPDARFSLFTAIPETESAAPASDASDEVALTPADVEAAIDEAIGRKDTVAAIQLAPEVAKLRPLKQAVVAARLRAGFPDDWKSLEKWWDKALKDAAAELVAAKPSVADDGTGQNPPAEPPGGRESAAEPPDLIDYPLTDSGNGQRVIAMFGRDIRFCNEMEDWLIWDSKRWAIDRSNLMRQKANEMARLLYYQCLKLPEGSRRTALSKHALAAESSRGISNALTEAARMPGIPVLARDLDQYPDHLNFRNGTVFLRDGSIQPHDREMLLTKLIERDYRPEAKCPIFQTFVEWTMGGPVDGNPDAELPETTERLVDFIQRVIGYSITGQVGEKAVFVFYGEGGDNGKTTLLTVFRELLGRDYGSLMLIDTIMHARSTDNTAREDMADLRGSRFVQTSEISKEDRLNEQRVKFLTQGMSTIKSRRLHEHLIEFVATHKLLMDCNYRPRVTGQDNAIWRRLIQIPFSFTVPEGKKDLRFSEKLKDEAEGILAWAVRGAIAWYKQGLGKPPEVIEAGQDWREHDDPLREFLSDWCNVDTDLFCPVSDLMTAYLLWAKEFGEKFPLARGAFNEALVSKGIKQDRRRVDQEPTRIWVGVELKAQPALKLRKGDQRESGSF